MRFRLKLVAVAVCMSTAYILAEEDWHRQSLGFHIGGVENVATIDARGTYKEFESGSDAEVILAYSTVLDTKHDLEFRLSQVTIRGTQYNQAGSGNEGNALDIGIDAKYLRMIYKRRFNADRNMFVPWLGIGPNIGMVEISEQEIVTTPYGTIDKDLKNRVSTVFGVDVYAGFDLYFFKDSALALSLAGRYNYDFVNGPLEGNVNSAAFIFGIKWDFDQYRE